MQLSSRILTALAVLILSVAVVAVRAGSSGTVEAATGTIDVLNVGTCYTTNDDVFAVGACDDGMGGDYDVTERDTISETGTVYATYSHDPKTADDNPRGILENSDLIKISIQDTERDKRTPVVLPVGDASTELSSADFAKIEAVFKNIGKKSQSGADKSSADREDLTADKVIKFTDTDEIVEANKVTYHVADDMYWGVGDYGDWDPSDDNSAADANNGRGAGTFQSGVKNGLTLLRDPEPTEDVDGDESPDHPVKYLPMDVSDSTVIKFFGCLDANNNDECDANEAFQELGTAALRLDEDRGPGRTRDDVAGVGAVAPWLNVQVHNANAVLQYIVYNTSERETLIGGKSDVETGANMYPADVNPPDFTKSEMDGDTPLIVRVKSDGDETTQNLRLYETGRFSGRYEGFVQLTDADGQGPDSDSAAEGDQPSNWGLDVMDATSHEMGGAAVIGVESGPLTIEYRDTDGSLKTRTIMIDTVPPAIEINAPAHKAQDQDTSPEFVGSFNDSESGLRAKSFQLYVDNSNDTNENGESGDELALGLGVGMGSDHGHVMPPRTGEVVRSAEDYKGYGGDEESQFGVIHHDDVYTDETDTLLKVDGDRFSDGAASGTFAESVHIRIRENGEELQPYNNTIDFHALVADVAGNIGFSDSDDAGPRLINDYGRESKDRKTGRYNVLGWYARHIFFLDEKEPEIYQEQSVTGFYGINDDKKRVPNRSGILIAFDGALDPESVSPDTFEVKLDPADAQDTSPPAATIAGVTVEGRHVYLLLGEELASDATPSVHIAAGQSIADPAGNRLTRGNITAFDVKDGIAPQLTVALSGGSGSGEGNEASDKLTNKAMTITVTSDEEINSTPSITVVCSNIEWTEGTGADAKEQKLSEFVSDRSGALPNSTANFPLDNSTETGNTTTFMCGDDTTARAPQPAPTFSRPGLQWEYEWQNFSGNKELGDGKLTVLAYGRDRQSYATKDRTGDKSTPASADTYNWGATTIEFNYDTTKPKLTPVPGDNAKVTDPRPFLLLNYDDKSSVSVTKLTIDATEQTEQVQMLGAKRFLYWPESLALGSHQVAVEAIDAAGNKTGSVEYKFTVAERATFDVKLIAGWNAVSLPANPIDPMIESVFTETIVDMVAAWNGENPEAPWSIATRMDGEWSTHSNFATLNKITARYGYWVHSQGFVTQSVALVGKGNREDPSTVPADLVEIPTNPGWNFVGVVDQDGDQTQDNYGDALKNGPTEVTIKDYLGKHVRAYRWDAIRSRFDVVEGDDEVTIGDGIWVYYGGGIAP